MLLRTVADATGIVRDPDTHDGPRGLPRPHRRPNAPRSVAENVRPVANARTDAASGSWSRRSVSSTLVDVLTAGGSWTTAPLAWPIPA